MSDDDFDIDDMFDAFEDQPKLVSHLPPVPLVLSSASDPSPAAASASKNKRKRDPTDSPTLAPAQPSTKRSRSHGSADGQDADTVEIEAVVDDEPIPEALDERCCAAHNGNGTGNDAEQYDPEDVNSGSVQFTKANVSTRHEVVLPTGFDRAAYAEWVRQYPFTLDPFQEYSIYCIQRNESVLVAAHTSAGKTVVAEYAIAQALKNKQRVIYTSPIKALSNQKYREMLEEFGDVGLMTGDVTINPKASCLVMTTEILRSMLYRGSEVLREISWVVYDEIHYMRDKDRGVVWEETLILLPPTVHFVFLSATIPNAKQFAQWISKIHNQPCHVVYTDYRPTPLQHYIYPAGGNGVHMVVDEKGKFREENFQAAMAKLNTGEDDSAGGGKKSASGKDGGAKGGAGGGKKGAHASAQADIAKIVKLIMAKDYHPVIIFSFIKKQCETLALAMSKLDFNNDDEKALVDHIFSSAISSLSPDDQTLPQISNILPLLRRGIGIHHSGLLPILKETIEILFQENLLKVLFATETFSIGLNMPAKTVVFTKIEKFDGKEARHLTGGEYIQMSGRAGRRGLDDKGIVIMMVDQKIDSDKAKGMVKGVSDALYSAFRLGYNMILNLMRVEGVSPEYLIRNSFRQFQNNAELPKLQVQCKELEEVYRDMEVEDEHIVRTYFDAKFAAEMYARDVHDVIVHPSYSLPFLKLGRLVKVVVPSGAGSSAGADGDKVDLGWGVVVQYTKRKSVKAAEDDGRDVADAAINYFVDVVLVVDAASAAAAGTKHPELLRPVTVPEESSESSSVYEAMTQSGEVVVVPVMLPCIDAISSIAVAASAINTSAIARNSKDAKSAAKRVLVETQRRVVRKFGSIPTLDPIKDMGISDRKFAELVEKVARYQAVLATHPLTTAGDVERRERLYAAYKNKVDMSEKIRSVREKIRVCEAVQQLDELKARKRVLRRLGFTDDRDVITVKGRVACEVSSGDPLLLSEMLFNGVFNDLSVEQVVALLGVFTFQDRVGPHVAKPKLRDELAKPLQVLQEINKRIVTVCKEAKLEINEQEVLDMYKPDLMDVVYAWAQGAKFNQICKMTDVFEGSLVRNFRLLEELLKQMGNAAKAIGNQDLELKFAEGITKIKRDIIFANSLYL
ncbi:rRNA-processing arch domain-domain-containing protein [Catenaria anguillulae PL171]|uniref:rRNA-processing arch domain-domain-containing protein n=1 Tax=Catenaria anguillulae PL171 TaxID=765915 RepID=A0A1Y2I1G3_9FUNG|nr:rRNA-processing arch domain-domain-containing protein [Catenaria anguillulae PL171]